MERGREGKSAGREATRETEDAFWKLATLIDKWDSPSLVSLSLKKTRDAKSTEGRDVVHTQAGFCKINLSIGAEPNLKFQDIIFEFYSSERAAPPPPREKTPNMNNHIK